VERYSSLRGRAKLTFVDSVHLGIGSKYHKAGVLSERVCRELRG